jgi:hypothetical protein
MDPLWVIARWNSPFAAGMAISVFPLSLALVSQEGIKPIVDGKVRSIGGLAQAAQIYRHF